MVLLKIRNEEVWYFPLINRATKRDWFPLQFVLLVCVCIVPGCHLTFLRKRLINRDFVSSLNAQVHFVNFGIGEKYTTVKKFITFARNIARDDTCIWLWISPTS